MCHLKVLDVTIIFLDRNKFYDMSHGGWFVFLHHSSTWQIFIEGLLGAKWWGGSTVLPALGQRPPFNFLCDSRWMSLALGVNGLGSMAFIYLETSGTWNWVHFSPANGKPSQSCLRGLMWVQTWCFAGPFVTLLSVPVQALFWLPARAGCILPPGLRSIRRGVWCRSGDDFSIPFSHLFPTVLLAVLSHLIH